MIKEWENEPDHNVWLESGFMCEVLRSQSLGTLSGYVYMTKNHPYFGKHYDMIDIECHGGLTYANITGELYCIGFDCGHAWDLIPMHHTALFSNIPSIGMNEVIYRNFEYVTNEVKNMARQLKKHAPSFVTDANVAKILLTH